jgi:hypothetical protein
MDGSLPTGLIPPVKVALARAVEKIPRPGALPGGAWYEPKWDGYRAVISRDGDETSIWSRQGKNLTRYFPDLIKAAAEQLPPGGLGPLIVSQLKQSREEQPINRAVGLLHDALSKGADPRLVRKLAKQLRCLAAVYQDQVPSPPRRRTSRRSGKSNRPIPGTTCPEP